MSTCLDSETAAHVVSSMGSSLFGVRYFELFRDALSIDQCTVFAFQGAAPPDPIILEGRSEQISHVARIIAAEYVADGFKRDPNVWRKPGGFDRPAVFSIQAEELLDSPYRLQFYDGPCLSHELTLMAKAENTLYYASFFRRDPAARFVDTDMRLVTGMAQFAFAAVRRHVDMLRCDGQPIDCLASSGGNFTNREALNEHLREVLLAESYGLSSREADVCASIILGYTTQGIGLTLGMSLNTVATYRKRAYRKMGISRQTELFSRYFKLVNRSLFKSH
jgi:DNA-binding CsgD family transcriptional regulator